jgi:hypothetical protein
MRPLERGAVPPAAAVFGQIDIKQALKAHEDAVVAARAADREWTLMERRGRGQAEEADARATADAISTAAKDPGPKNVTKYERDLVDSKRRAQATKLHEARCWGDVETAFREHGSELEAMAHKAFTEARNAFLKALDEAERKHDEVVKLLPWKVFYAAQGELGGGVFRLVEGPPSSVVPAPPLHTLDDTKATTASLFASLRQLGAPAAPAAITNPHQTLVANGEGNVPLQQPPRHSTLAEQQRQGFARGPVPLRVPD